LVCEEGLGNRKWNLGILEEGIIPMTSVAHLNRKPRPSNGFSTIELAVTLGIILVVTAIAIPSFLNTYRMYQLSDAASRVAGILKSTRLEAIRRNTPVPCMITQTAAIPPLTRIWTDSNKDSAEDPGDARVHLTDAVNLIGAGSVPGTGALAAAVGAQTLTTPPLANATINFDQRGAGNVNAVYSLYIANSNALDIGYRALILFPSGSIQIWQADGQGNWRFLK
jgi:type II secretory pathway pseudopilin PulG